VIIIPSDDHIDQGDVITCPKCQREMLLCLKRPESGSLDYPQYFEDRGWGGAKGQKTVCPLDGEPWMVIGPYFAVHVAGKGWVRG
jgi:hypothetical protein